MQTLVLQLKKKSEYNLSIRCIDRSVTHLKMNILLIDYLIVADYVIF